MDEEFMRMFTALSSERQESWLAAVREIAGKQEPEPCRHHQVIKIMYSLPVSV